MIKRIPIDDLKPGMYVNSFDLSWFKHPFLSTRLGIVRDQRLIDELKRLGVALVEVDTSQEVREEARREDAPAQDASRPAPIQAPKPPQLPQPSDYDRTVKFARKLFDQAISIAKGIEGDIANGRAVKINELSPILDRLVESVSKNENVLHVLVSLKSYDAYTYTHSVNLAALGVLLGNAAGQDEETLHLTGMTGILHDVGKCLLPRDIVNKPGPLTMAEMKQMKLHPELGYEYLRRQGDVPETVLRGVREHHERLDGKGYPRQILGEEIHPVSSVISVVDIYDALTSDRVYRPRISPHAALRTLFNLRGQAFPENVVDQLIRRLGIYPAFSLVQLKNGCYASVVRQNPEKPLYPEVMVLCDGNKRALTRRRVDTWRLCGEMRRKEFEIDRAVEYEEIPAYMLGGLK